MQPGSMTKAIPAKKMKELVKEARDYSFDFYRWKKIFELKKHWLIYKKSVCPRCGIKTQRTYMGLTDRLTYFCDNCQQLYTGAKKQKKRT
jgi:endonuclease-8